LRQDSTRKEGYENDKAIKNVGADGGGPADGGVHRFGGGCG
jgi:hypothetical protein